MSTPALFTRRATDVEAMQLCDRRDALHAELWLRAHGVEAAFQVGHADGLLIAQAADGTLMPVRLGQWLIRDLVLGDFTVADAVTFPVLHQQARP